jgi:hypothetical protein
MKYAAFNRYGDCIADLEIEHNTPVTTIIDAIRKPAKLRLPNERYHIAWDGDGIGEVFRIERNGKSYENIRTKTVVGTGLFEYEEIVLAPNSLVARLVPQEE